jgi:hypothetical protein
MAAHRVLGLTAERASHMFESALGAIRPPPSLVGFGFSSTVSGTSRSGERSTIAMLMDHIPRCPCSWYVIQLHDRIVHVLEEFMPEAGATKGRNLRLDVRCIRSGASRDRHGDVVWLDFIAPHRHLVVDVTVTSARMNTNVPRIGAHLPIPGSLALGAQHGKLDADLRTSALLGMPSVQSVHGYYPFAMENGGRVAPMAAELVYRLHMLVAARRFPCMGTADSRSCALTIMSVCNISFVEQVLFLFGVLGGCAARVQATSFCCSSWYFGFLPPRCFVGGQC